ncbi:hydrogenase expression/formation protein HypE [Shewanella schlegeliana]|uniref:Hydrogenase expression/formation protein HypE n=1 Tax=Shewanella schlegeliana TaxID=190308 RepID=A0ABS1SZ69_9GAMM|nr:hydrogenase expression/formation protein HypE [Shewanella schlegeliana]MBL4913842.1 hydrogenase expression/formation protein HypE [Shewanella schlegeliana]MCL1108774.1 hydrogenase expression/formation protein HypE [Shewanella schlegeliana]GIU26086.1 hydrogenase expression/formation protein HypE [Shewanella schlegeliana]
MNQTISKKVVQLSHGGGGKEMNHLIKDLFFKAFDNPILRSEEDAAVLHFNGDVAFTTDSFTVAPLFFSGGDIGKLSIAGTVNDLAMMAAEPQYLSCSFIIEEGFEIAKLKTIVESMAKELKQSGARIVCGDTKVVPRGCADGLFINTTGVGRILQKGISVKSVTDDDVIIVSRDIGRHGAAILMAREGLTLDSELTSDCATLWPIVEQLIAANIEIHAMRDATRGGLSAVLNEWALASDVEINVHEEAIPVCDEVRGLCELYGFEPFDLANEGTFILAVPKKSADATLEIMKRFCHCEQAAIIGDVNQNRKGKVILNTPWGSTRYLDLPQGELLPRIC